MTAIRKSQQCPFHTFPILLTFLFCARYVFPNFFVQKLISYWNKPKNKARGWPRTALQPSENTQKKRIPSTIAKPSEGNNTSNIQSLIQCQSTVFLTFFQPLKQALIFPRASTPSPIIALRILALHSPAKMVYSSSKTQTSGEN